MRFRRALDRRNVTEALSAATEIQVVGLVEALELTLLLADRDPAKYERAALRWHARFMREVPKVEMRESQAILSLLALVPGYATSSRQRDFFFPQHRPEHTYDEEHAIGLTGERPESTTGPAARANRRGRDRPGRSQHLGCSPAKSRERCRVLGKLAPLNRRPAVELQGRERGSAQPRIPRARERRVGPAVTLDG
jgi:hypothetical protein